MGAAAKRMWPGRPFKQGHPKRGLVEGGGGANCPLPVAALIKWAVEPPPATFMDTHWSRCSNQDPC